MSNLDCLIAMHVIVVGNCFHADIPVETGQVDKGSLEQDGKGYHWQMSVNFAFLWYTCILLVKQ